MMLFDCITRPQQEPAGKSAREPVSDKPVFGQELRRRIGTQFLGGIASILFPISAV
jgi:hypothetical protein